MVLFAAFLLVAMGIRDCINQRKKTRVLEEILSFMRFVKSELQYRSSDFESLSLALQNENYKYIKCDKRSFYIEGACDKTSLEQFRLFSNHLGTTDRDGQLNLCDEYIEKINELLSEYKTKEKSRIRVNTALSFFGALCIVVLFV